MLHTLTPNGNRRYLKAIHWTVRATPQSSGFDHDNLSDAIRAWESLKERGHAQASIKQSGVWRWRYDGIFDAG